MFLVLTIIRVSGGEVAFVSGLCLLNPFFAPAAAPYPRETSDPDEAAPELRAAPELWF